MKYNKYVNKLMWNVYDSIGIYDGQKISIKNIPKYWKLIGQFCKISLLYQSCCVYSLGIFGNIWAIFTPTSGHTDSDVVNLKESHIFEG